MAKNFQIGETYFRYNYYARNLEQVKLLKLIAGQLQRSVVKNLETNQLYSCYASELFAYELDCLENAGTTICWEMVKFDDDEHQEVTANLEAELRHIEAMIKTFN